MYCKKCGNELQENQKFCPVCGEAVSVAAKEETYENEVTVPVKEENQKDVNDDKNVKAKKVKSIINIAAGGVLLLLGFMEAGFDWGWIALACGAGFLATGILRLLNKPEKVSCIIEIVTGGLTLFFGILCDLDYDWGYVGILIGIGVLVVGILGLSKKSSKVIAIIKIVFGGIVVLLGVAAFEYIWGEIALVAGGAPLLAVGIFELIYSRKKIA